MQRKARSRPSLFGVAAMLKKKMPDGMTVRAYAKANGLSLCHVYHLVWAGKLPAKQVRGRWLITMVAMREARNAEARYA